ncbi:hypothetical protein ACQJBY_054049 [Aegilops geniculata]
MLVWNVRGLNNRARRTGVRSLVSSTGTPIVCLQETKLAVVTSTIVMEDFGADFDDYSACWLLTLMGNYYICVDKSHS